MFVSRLLATGVAVALVLAGPTALAADTTRPAGAPLGFVGCTPIAGLIPDSLGYINGQAAAECTHPRYQTAKVTVLLYRSGSYMGSRSITCYPGQFNSDGWCLTPMIAASNPSGWQTFCAIGRISYKNSSGDYWHNGETESCATY